MDPAHKLNGKSPIKIGVSGSIPDVPTKQLTYG